MCFECLVHFAVIPNLRKFFYFLSFFFDEKVFFPQVHPLISQARGKANTSCAAGMSPNLLTETSKDMSSPVCLQAAQSALKSEPIIVLFDN